ncbi:chloride channel protein [bacterium]|nr:chloride channel protein [bacterium]
MRERLQAYWIRVGRFIRSDQVLILVMAAVVGVLSAYGAILFRWLIHWSQFAFFQSSNVDLAYLETLPWYWKLLAPALGGLLVAAVVVKWSPESKGSGIPEVIESVALRGGAVRKRVAPLKAVAAAICIGSGGSAGREGPVVHIGAAVGSWIAQSLRVSVKQMRTLVGCGVAGGIAATFNTPFAGALFAVEVVLGDFGTAKISPIVIASVVATVISRHYIGDFPQITVPPFHEDINLITIIPYFIVGIGSAFVSAGFIKSLGWGWKLADRWKFSPFLLPAIGGLLVGTIGIFVPDVFGVGYDTINAVLENQIGLGMLILILLLKVFATSATLTSGGSGGVFAPSLVIGALLGGIVGVITMRIAPGWVQSPHALALVGMGALVAGTTRAPISAVLVIFEMSYEYSVILPLMAACIPSVLISAWLHRDSIYIAKLTHKGVSLKARGDVNLLKGLQVGDVVQPRVESINAGAPLTEVLERFMETRFPIMWMVDGNGKLLGVLESKNLEIAILERESLLELIVAQDIAVPVEAPIHPKDDLSFAMKLFADVPFEVLPVVDKADGHLLGDLLRSDVIDAYNRELAMRDSMATTVDAINVADRLGHVDIGDGYALIEYEVPVHLVGKTLVEIDLRKKAEAQCVLIKRHKQRLVPRPDTVFQAGDALLLAGDPRKMNERLRKL